MTSYQRLQDSNNNDSGNEISFNRISNHNEGMRNGMAGAVLPEPNSIQFFNFTKNGYVSKVVVKEYPYLKPFSNSPIVVISEANDRTITKKNKFNKFNNNFNFGPSVPLMMTLEEFNNTYVDTNEEINDGIISTIPPAGGRRRSRRRRGRRTSRTRRRRV